ncbi:MAG: hypothetical protein IKX06_01085 [Clostridia bacterium]|nr:hypothetical protein [Clostridia bacterium]
MINKSTKIAAILIALVLTVITAGCAVSGGGIPADVTDKGTPSHSEPTPHQGGDASASPTEITGSETAEAPGDPSDVLSEAPSSTPENTEDPSNVPGPSDEDPSPSGSPQFLKAVKVCSFSFDEEMMRFVEQSQKGNYMISPLSFRYALGMLTAGAAGETRDELLKALGLESETELEEVIKSFNSFSEGFNEKVKNDIERYESLSDEARSEKNKPAGALRVADSVWKRIDIESFCEDFKLKMELYDAELRDFTEGEVIGEVNEWADQKTEGMIPELLPQNYDTENLAVILINALYFKDSWKDTFTDAGKQTFYKADGNETQKEFMFSELKCRYYKDSETELAEIPMANNVTALFVIGSFEGLEAKLEKAVPVQARVFLPKFEIETSLCSHELCDLLSTLGVKQAFGSGADFSAMLKNHPVYVDDIIQKTKIKLDETGVEAAAVTAVLMKDEAVIGGDEPVEFRADRPFRFFIRTGESKWTKDSGTVMFAGRLSE